MVTTDRVQLRPSGQEAARGWVPVSMARGNLPPFVFVGWQMTGHHRSFPPDWLLGITLWRAAPDGYVVGFPVCGTAGPGSDCVRVETLEDAIAFLEARCAPGARPAPLAARPLEALAQLHLLATFEQAFAALVGEVLACWVGLDPQLPPGIAPPNAITAPPVAPPGSDVP